MSTPESAGKGTRPEHDLAPTDPKDGDRFTCSLCGDTSEYVDLNDGQPGEWVSVETPAGEGA